ncbi:hypothetical protein [Emcibacter sp.]|uniref:hypothetical protein n=1 Tax=Emcibacter sp. TaxID=1979954 RepID=UPI002AA83090|nr:hypothetical protein [Emcibacter sp.]
MSGYSLAGLFSAFSGTDGGAGYKSLSFDHSRSGAVDGSRRGHSHHGRSHHSAREGRELEKHPFERSSFQINLSKVGRQYLQSDVGSVEAGTDDGQAEQTEEQDFTPFRNHGHRRSAQAFFENMMRKLVTVFAIKILGDFLTALKDGASLDQLSLDESKTDIAEATENQDSVVTVNAPAEDDDETSAPSLVSLSISVGFQIDITIGQQSSDGGVLSSQTVNADNPVIADQGTTTNLVA